VGETGEMGETGQNAVTRQGLILIVEDDEATRELMVEAIGYEACTIACAADGADALRMLAEMRTPDLILLDWRMPMPGGVFVEQYRALPPPHAPIVVVSAAAEIVNAALQASASGFLRKPFDLDELTQTVRTFVRPNRAAGPTASAASTGSGAAEIAVLAPATSPTVPSATGGADRTRRKRTVEEWHRRQTLNRMAREVAVIRTASVRVRDQLQVLLAVEQSRRLTAEETDLVRRLRWESERHRWELQTLREQFAQLRRLPSSSDRDRQT
jgi:CheY-like chemotaxis protein